MGDLHVGAFPHGLWRYKVQQWLPRPIYHYYSALMDAFRPGMRLHAVGGCPPGVRALVGEDGESRTMALINAGPTSATVRVPWSAAAMRLRIAPDSLPVASDLPLSAFVPQPTDGGGIAIELKPMELSIVAQANKPLNFP